MTQQYSRGVALAVAVAGMLALCAGCSDDACVNCRDYTPNPTLANIWPNADGTFWTYRVKVHVWGDEASPCDSVYESEEDVPAVPSLDEVENLLAHHAAGSIEHTYTALYEQEFAGDTTSGSGVAAQNLRTAVYRPGGQRVQAMGGRANAFVRRLYAARPDLRHALAERLGEHLTDVVGVQVDGWSPEAGCLELECPLLIHGGTWEKSDQWIGTYGDLDTLLAWKFLDADLSAGHEFTHQLVPVLADDVFLHCRVLGRTSTRTEAGTFRKALDCMYVVDYGVYEILGTGGTPHGYCRAFDYGRVIYVPDVGPVYTYERILVSAGEPVGLGFGEKILTLVDTGVRSD